MPRNSEVKKEVSLLKEHYFIYASIVLVVILGLMTVGAVIYIGVITVENEVLTEENQELKTRLDEIDDEIRALSDRIEESMRDVSDLEDWNKEIDDGFRSER